MSAIINPGDTIWTRGYVWGTIAGGTVDDVPFGAMQNFSVEDSLTLKEAIGPESLGAVAVGAAGRTVTGSCQWLKVRLRNYILARGGTVSHTSGITTYSSGIADEPSPFNMHFMSPANGSETELKLFGLVAPTLTTPLAQRDFSMPNVNFNCYGNGTNFFQFLLPGNQTTS